MHLWLFEEATYKRVPAVKERNEHGRLLDGAVGTGRLEPRLSQHGGAQLSLGDKRLKRVA